MNKTLLLNTNLSKSEILDRDYFDSITTNIGNTYITYACSRIFGLDYSNTILYNSFYDKNSSFYNIEACGAEASSIILILQDQLRADFPDDWYENASRVIETLGRVSAPMIALSLSANSFMADWDLDLHTKLSETKIRFFKLVSERCQSIGVRGEFAAHVLDKLGIRNHAVIGCPSFFEMGRDRVVAPVDPQPGKFLGVTGALRLKKHEERCVYLQQGDAEWPVVELLFKPGGKSMFPSPNQYPLTGALLHPLLGAATEGRAQFLSCCADWKDYIARNCFAVAGTRLHGAIVALNAGVPALVANSDARARETCTLFGIPWVPEGFGPDVELADIYERCDVSLINKTYKARFDVFAEWAANNGLTLSFDTTRDALDSTPLKPVPQDLVTGRVLHILNADRNALSQSVAALTAEVSQLRVQFDRVEREAAAGRLVLAEEQEKSHALDAEIEKVRGEAASQRNALELVNQTLLVQLKEKPSIQPALDLLTATTYKKQSVVKLLRRKLRRLIRHRRLAPEFFDARYYCDRYPDVRESDFDPYEHYMTFGIIEGRRPNATFEIGPFP